MQTPALRSLIRPAARLFYAGFFSALFLVFQGCSSDASKRGSMEDLEAWDRGKVYNSSDGKYYHSAPPPSSRDIYFQESVREAREG